VVLDVFAQPGEIVNLEQSLLQLTNPAGLEVQSSVIEEDLPYVQIGQQADVYFDAQPEVAVTGRVSRIVPQRIPGKDRPLYAVFLSLESVPEGVVAGMTADAAIIIARKENVLRLPRALVRARADDTAQIDIWTDRGPEKRDITVGLRGDVYIEILDGLAEGDQIVGE
jgi:HlyD family secretion protein